MKLLRILLVVLSFPIVVVSTASSPFKQLKGDVSSVYGVISRVLQLDKPDDIFKLQIIDDAVADGTGYFNVSSENGKVVVVASSASDLAYGVGWYLRKKCNMSFAWERAGGNQVYVPKEFPVMKSHVFKQRNFQVSYFNNVCTFSYSYVWYSWKDWERHIDWAALGGINLVIAYTGQEELWRKTFATFNISSSDYAKWTNGAAYLTWSRGQSMHGVGSPLDLKFMKQQWQLQKKILKRLRSLGILPVLPTFQGNLPPHMKEMFPDANMSISQAGTPHATCWLDATDPLFSKIQKVYMEILINDFGSDHWYAADGYFNKGSVPWLTGGQQSDEEYSSNTANIKPDEDAKAHSKAVYESMSQVDPDAIWLYQGWVWREWGNSRLPYMKGWVSGVPLGKFVVLDMVDEAPKERIWNRFPNTSAPFFGAPFIWSVLHNFGGNTGMWGSLETLVTQPFEAERRAAARLYDTSLGNGMAKSSMLGTGAAPEGIDQNPLYYTLLLDLPYLDMSRFDLNDYLGSYCIERLGQVSEHCEEAQIALLKSVYSHENNLDALKVDGEFQHEKAHDAITAMPLYNEPRTYKWYNIEIVFQAWKSLIQAGEAFYKTPGEEDRMLPRTLNYDIVNTGREVLSKLALKPYQEMTKDQATSGQVVAAGKELLELMKDLDSLLCTELSFLSYAWFEKARALAQAYAIDEKFIVLQARSQTTTWDLQMEPSGGEAWHSGGNLRGLSRLHDYANKHWAGQIHGFYSLRLECYVSQAREQPPNSVFILNKPKYYKCLQQVSFDWTNDVNATKYPTCQKPTGSSVSISRQLLAKYSAGAYTRHDLKPNLVLEELSVI